jgi:hypothetical protein
MTEVATLNAGMTGTAADTTEIEAESAILATEAVTRSSTSHAVIVRTMIANETATESLMTANAMAILRIGNALADMTGIVSSTTGNAKVDSAKTSVTVAFVATERVVGHLIAPMIAEVVVADSSGAEIARLIVAADVPSTVADAASLAVTGGRATNQRVSWR